MQTFVAIKNPKLFEPDYVFKVPDVFCRNGYVNMNFEYAKQWYVQIYPSLEVCTNKF